MRNSFNDLTYTELVAKRDELRKKYLGKRIDKVMGHLENPLELRTLSRQLARLNTIIHEYAMGIRKNTK